MRIRLALTLSIRRDATPGSTEEAPGVDEKGSAILERAEPHPLGFIIPPTTTDPFEEKR